MMRVLTEDQVKSLMDYDTALAAVEEADRQFGLAPEIQSRPPVLFITGPHPSLGKKQFGQFVVKGASGPQHNVAGALLYSRKYPYVFLWDLDSSEPIGLVAAYWLSIFRVGLTALVAARRLAPAAVGKIAVFGAGRFATEAARMLADEWPAAEMHVVTRSLETATAFAKTLPGSAIPSTSHEAAVKGADIVLTMTSAGEAFIHSGWLKPGALLLSMGGDHEVDISVLREVDALIVDDLAYCMGQGDLGAWHKLGQIREGEVQERLRGTIGDVVAGTIPGRNSPQERLMVILQGLTACDVAVAKVVLDRAEAEQLGQLVQL